jgi:hypothetical protein
MYLKYGTQPKTEDFGLHRNRTEQSEWPLHVKPVIGSISYEELLRLPVTKNETRAKFEKEISWCTDEKNYVDLMKRANKDTRTKGRCLLMKKDILRLTEVGKYEIAQTCHSMCNAFDTAEPARKRRRALLEPLINDLIFKTDLCGIKLSTSNDVHEMFTRKFVILFDASAYYDQFRLSEDVRNYNGILSGNTLLRSTVLGTGFRKACDVAHTTSELLIDFPMNDVPTILYIDNFGFGCDDLDELQRVAKTFVERCATAGVILNDTNPPIIGRDVMQTDCLGEHLDILSKTKCLTAQSVGKLVLAVDVINKQRTENVGRKQMAAVYGMLFYATRVLNMDVSMYYNALRYYRDLGAICSIEGWNGTAPRITGTALEELLMWCAVASRNTPVPFAKDDESIDATIIVDASHWGYGAILSPNEGPIREISKQWNAEDRAEFDLRRSTVAEPLAVRRSICELLCPGKYRSVRIMSDHSGLVYTGNRGYARSYYYNEMIRCIRDSFPGTKFTFGFIQGIHNYADGLSRGYEG